MKHTALSFIGVLVTGIVAVTFDSVTLALLFFTVFMLLPLISKWEYEREVRNDNVR